MCFRIDNIGTSKNINLAVYNSAYLSADFYELKFRSQDLKAQIECKDALEYREVSECLEIRFRCVPFNAFADLINVRYKFTSEKGAVLRNFGVNKWIVKIKSPFSKGDRYIL